MTENLSKTPQLRLVAWELTRSCILSCRHCRASATEKRYDDELSTEECLSIIDSICKMGPCIVILTGGEPLLRKDIFQITSYGNSKGLRMVMATCGALLNHNNCSELIKSGISRISLSIDGATAKSHDEFRGVNGAFDSLLKGIEAAKAAGLQFQINTTVTKNNLHELPEIYSLAVKLGSVSFHPFLLVPTGRAAFIDDQVISAQEYENVLNWIYNRQLSKELPVKPTCAPHYYRILRQRELEAGRTVNSKSHGLDALTRGCLGGQGFAFISHTGIVQICGFLDIEAGNLRKCNYDFSVIWQTSDLFNKIRNINNYKGKCGYCEYHTVCGGCRARAFTVNGDYLSEEPQCLYQPENQKETI